VSIKIAGLPPDRALTKQLMKKFIVSLMMALPILAFAQVQKGRSFLSGSVGYSSTKPDNPPAGETKFFNRFAVDAKYGFMIGNTWAIGVAPSFSSQTQKYTNGGKNVSNDLTVGPFVRKYFALSDKFFLHLDASYSYEQITGYQESPLLPGGKQDSPKTTSNVAAITPGASYFISDKVALTAMIGKLAYSKYKNHVNDGSGFDVNFGVTSFNLGATVFF
jgi:outer membrane immunogenic protein